MKDPLAAVSPPVMNRLELDVKTMPAAALRLTFRVKGAKDLVVHFYICSTYSRHTAEFIDG